jgi:hypothetical protein
MCGLLGFEYTENSGVSNEQKAMVAAILAIGNDSRGGDSWGFYDFANLTRGVGELTERARLLIGKDRLIGHTRKATTGSICAANSHPFDIGDIIGAHNGIITNHSELQIKYNRKFEVDSMHIFAHLNEDKDLSDLSGYGSIVWTRKSDPTRIYLCKLSGGDLSVHGIKASENADEATGIIWSSDDGHAEMAIKAAGIDTFEFKIETGQVYYIQDGCLYKEDMKLEFQSRYNTYMPDWRNGGADMRGMNQYRGYNRAYDFSVSGNWSEDDSSNSEYSSLRGRPTPPLANGGASNITTTSKDGTIISTGSGSGQGRTYDQVVNGFLEADRRHTEDVETLSEAWESFQSGEEKEVDLDDLEELEYVSGIGWLKHNDHGESIVVKGVK